MAPVAAVATRPLQTSGGISSRVDARQLDELLAGMLLDIENIPDLRPGQTPAPDIDSIRCPDLTWNSSTRGRSTSSRTGPTMSPVNGYGGSHHGGSNHDSLLDTSLSLSVADEAPYHTRLDSRPFSYGAVTSSPVLPRRRSPSPNSSPNRRPSREPMISRTGLESPRLVRRMSGSVGAVSGNNTTTDGPGINNINHSDSIGGGGLGSFRRSPSPSPEPGSRGSTLRRERSQTLTNRIMAGEPSPPATLTRSHVTRSASRLDDPDTVFAPDTLSRSFSGTSSSWLATQQRKLIERREAGRRADRGRQEARVMTELRSRIGQQYNRTNTNTTASSSTSRYGRYGDFEDGYVSDTTLFSDTSRESSPVKTFPFSPLSIATHHQTTSSNDHHRYDSQNRRTSASSKGGSAPSSPNVASKTATLNFARDRLQRLNQQYANTTRSLSRKYSDASYDRERSFVTVKRAIASDIKGESALSQLQAAPLGHVNYYPSSSPNDGLLTTMHQQSGDELTWQSDTEGGGQSSAHRPVTPGFPPSTPTTPYLNQGLPPKSPTMQRKEQNLTSSSVVGAYRSPSPHNNGHASPAPSVYHGPSRRSSLSSLTDASQQQEIIHSHPKFVKDISKFWYKPTISRDEAINILRSTTPGTFIVRDSNSFPGAFGLAVKVATPPPNVKASTSGGDPANELVRHFLIEPTARGVRLKGCSNEPVFGSLSALVYQHSITALALPCRLTMPERDPAVLASPASTAAIATNGTTSSVDSNSLLLQGAACTVLYLHSLDTESLTGPQAVRRAVTNLLSSSAVRPTPVHFKVSSAGITLTDNHRTLFFRQHFPVSSISHCGTDPDDRRWQHNTDAGEPLASLRMFGFVAKKGATRNQNQCHILAELEPEQPATAICNFVTKVMMTSANRANLV